MLYLLRRDNKTDIFGFKKDWRKSDKTVSNPFQSSMSHLKVVLGIRSFQENGSLSISPKDLILFFFIKHFLSALKIS